jgi:hypothetical protein
MPKFTQTNPGSGNHWSDDNIPGNPNHQAIRDYYLLSGSAFEKKYGAHQSNTVIIAGSLYVIWNLTRWKEYDGVANEKSYTYETLFTKVNAQSQGSTDMNGAGVLRNTGDALSYTAGAIGGAQIGMMQYRSSLSIHSKVGTFPRFSSTYSSLGKFSGRLGTAGALVGVGFNINDLSTGEIGLGRFSYRLGSIGAAAGTGPAIGGPWGAVAGTAVGGISPGFEYIYDNYLVPLGNEIQYQIWNFENAIKNGWYPGR